MKKYIPVIIILSLLMCSPVGCTSPSTKMAQQGSLVSQAVNDGVHRDMFKALSRENFEVAKLNILLEAEKMKEGKTAAEKTVIDASANQNIAALKEFAQKRDFMVEWDRDHERANTMKIVTVDTKLYSEIGILNYLGGRISDATKKVVGAIDVSMTTWNEWKASTQPAK